MLDARCYTCCSAVQRTCVHVYINEKMKTSYGASVGPNQRRIRSLHCRYRPRRNGKKIWKSCFVLNDCCVTKNSLWTDMNRQWWPQCLITRRKHTWHTHTHPLTMANGQALLAVTVTNRLIRHWITHRASIISDV